MTKVSLSFDDGRGDNYRAVKDILEPLRIPATFNITIKYIENNLKNEEMPCSNQPLLKSEIIDISNNPILEIAGHGYKHKNDRDNLILGVNKLREWCELSDIEMGIASPCSLMTEEEIVHNRESFKRNNIKYVRLGDRIDSYVEVKRWCRRLNRILHISPIFYWVYKETLLSNSESFIFYSVPILRDNSLHEVLYLLKKAIEEKKSIILMFHSILKPGEKYYRDLWSWDYYKFLELCHKLKKYENQKEIQLCKTIELNVT